MKLSDAIKLAITSGEYSVQNEFMCLVLPELNFSRFIGDVEDMVYSIWPIGHGAPLSCALHYAGLLNLNDGTWSKERTHLYCRQLYCWWVFDLKRKGL